MAPAPAASRIPPAFVQPQPKLADFPLFGRSGKAASGAISLRMPSRLYSVKGQRPRASCSSASSRETARTSPAGHSLAPPASCSTSVCTRPALIDRFAT